MPILTEVGRETVELSLRWASQVLCLSPFPVIVLDYDADGNLVGIDIDNASKKVQLKELTLRKLPFDTQTFAA